MRDSARRIPEFSSADSRRSRRGQARSGSAESCRFPSRGAVLLPLRAGSRDWNRKRNLDRCSGFRVCAAEAADRLSRERTGHRSRWMVTVRAAARAGVLRCYEEAQGRAAWKLRQQRVAVRGAWERAEAEKLRTCRRSDSVRDFRCRSAGSALGCPRHIAYDIFAVRCRACIWLRALPFACDCDPPREKTYR